MRRKFSPSKSKLDYQMSLRREQTYNNLKNIQAKHYRYLCHYNNAVYMGGMNSYKKHGKGILLHDDGGAVITQYTNDIPSGHTIIFRENSITSTIVNSSISYQVAYKAGRTIIKIPFNENIDKAHGIGVLIDYVENKIFQLIFKNGLLTEKILNLDHKIHNEVFNKKQIGNLIGIRHEQAFQLTFQTHGNLDVKFYNNNLVIGYFDSLGEIHGLAFKMYVQNVEVSGEKSLYMKSLQRGYYKHSILQTFGQKYFSNGNKYVGQFENGQFNGRGILLCPAEMKWVYGKFKQNKLVEVVDSNNKKFTQNDFQVWSQGLREIHQINRERWIDLDIELPDELYFYRILQDSLRGGMTYVSPDHQQKLKEEEKNFQRIQAQFEQGYSGNSALSFVENELDKHYNVHSSKSSLNNQRPLTKGQLIQDLFQRKLEYSPNSTKYRTTKISESPRLQNSTRMEDPFKVQLIKVPYSQQNPKNTFIQKDPQLYNSDYRERYFPRQFGKTFHKRYPMHYPLLQSGNKYRYNPIEEVYNKSSVQFLNKQRQQLRRKADQDQKYINKLRRELSQSPRRVDYSSPLKYESPPLRSTGKISKRLFDNQNSFEEPYPKDSEGPIYRNFEYQPLYQQPNPKKSRLAGQRQSPFQKNPYKPQNSPRNNFIQNNYKLWS